MNLFSGNVNSGAYALPGVLVIAVLPVQFAAGSPSSFVLWPGLSDYFSWPWKRKREGGRGKKKKKKKKVIKLMFPVLARHLLFSLAASSVVSHLLRRKFLTCLTVLLPYKKIQQNVSLQTSSQGHRQEDFCNNDVCRNAYTWQHMFMLRQWAAWAEVVF